MTTIGETISRIRGGLKAVKEDAFVTDRYLYSVALKYAKMVIRRTDNENKLMRYSSLFKPIPCMDLIEVDKIEACCIGVPSNCTIMRTKERIIGIMEGALGPIFRTVSSLDGSQEAYKTQPATYVSMTRTTTFRFNKNKYYWFLDGYLYFPNLEWDAVRLEVMPETDISCLICSEEEQCIPIQEQSTHVPDYLFAEIESMVLKEILTSVNIPQDGPDDKQNQIR